ncbi:major histocompatibility complex class I-related gene protein [Larimichthys crocea]|uniref:major histocompatibility complex class I-related gene protein n=1 Tax=Larimichthys crocea TaxID=215358 RepID=UPI0009010358|nr:major histocompatibility complex class I-related gene protein [Larimichthys crocea]
MKVFLLLFFCHFSSPVKHTMKFFFTASSGVPNLPEVVGLALLNDIEVGYCDSNIKIGLAKQDWMEKLRDGDPKYWKLHTQECTVHQQRFKVEFHNLMKRLNKTDGVHILQRLSGCEWDEETGEIKGFHQYGYNGEDFLVFNLETETWIAPKPQSVVTKHLWDSDTTTNNFWKNTLNHVCIDCLQKHLKYGRSSLLRTELPSVSLLQKTPSSPVSCHATGFYPDRASLSWRKNGEEQHEDVDHGEILPNHDGTFQMSVDLKLSSVAPEDWRRYDCVFHLSGVEDDIVTRLDKEEIRTNWVVEQKISYATVLIIAAAVSSVFVFMAAVGFFVYKKITTPETTLNSETETETSTHSVCDSDVTQDNKTVNAAM